MKVHNRKEIIMTSMVSPVNTHAGPAGNTNGVTKGVRLNEVSREGCKSHANVVQTWKRRARAGQQEKAATSSLTCTGKRKVGVAQEVDKEEIMQKGGRCQKIKGARGLELRDEEDENSDGSGMEGLSHSPADRYDDIMLEL